MIDPFTIIWLERAVGFQPSARSLIVHESQRDHNVGEPFL